MASAVQTAEKFVAWVHWTKAIVAIWFVRLFWPMPILWGLFDAWVREFGIEGLAYSPTEDDVAIRTFTGGMLFLVWLFMARRRGPFTLNRDGILERRPNQAAPAAALPQNPYARMPQNYGNTK